MKEDKLTENGVDKLVGGINDVVMQAIAVTKKEKNGQQFYGYASSHLDAN